MKKISVLFFISAFAITACKKDVTFKAPDQVSQKQTPITIIEAKRVFLSNFDIETQFSSNAFIFNPEIKRKELNWDIAACFNNDQQFSIVELPMEFNKGISCLIKGKNLMEDNVKLASQSKLLFLKNRMTGRIYTSIMTVIPKNIQISQSDFHYNLIPSNFTGIVVFSNWDGELNNSWLYENGTVTEKITNKREVVSGYANPNGNGQNCEDYIIDTWQRDCYYDYNEDYYCTDWGLIDSHNVTICGSSGGGGGIYTEQIITEEELAESFDNRISDAELANCLNSVFSNLKGMEDGMFGTIIQNFSSELPNYNWKVKSASLTTTNDNAITATLPVGGYFVTTFNMTTLTGASDLSIARTMIHECIHAYLSYLNYYEYGNYTQTYLELLKTYREKVMGNQNLPNEQHAIMEKEFVNNVIAPALMQYGISRGYNLDPNYYKDLAWGGLDFDHNSQLTTGDKIRIQARVSDEQTGIGWGTIMCPLPVE